MCEMSLSGIMHRLHYCFHRFQGTHQRGGANGFREKVSLQINTTALFNSPLNPKSFQDFPSHQILRHMYEALNIDENKN